MKRKILVIEDDAPIRRGIVDALEFAGYEVLEAGDGDRGMRTAVRAGYDLLLLDLVLPDMSGMAVFEPGQPTLHLPIYGSDEIADVTGAGDTVMAALTLAMAAGASAGEAARVANVAGGLVVMKRGTATVSAAELSRALSHG